CLLLAGAGASVQHPIGSSLTARAFEGARQRTALGTYNFAGDIGKMLLPATAAWLIALWQWRNAITFLAGAAVLAALILFFVLRPTAARAATAAEEAPARNIPALPRDVARR